MQIVRTWKNWMKSNCACCAMILGCACAATTVSRKAAPILPTLARLRSRAIPLALRVQHRPLNFPIFDLALGGSTAAGGNAIEVIILPVDEFDLAAPLKT